MEFVAVFLVTLLLLAGLVAALMFGRTPSYRPDRGEVLSLLNAVAEGRADADRWYLFLSIPVTHDPELESIRRACVVVDEGDEDHEPALSGLNIYDLKGRERIRRIADELEEMIGSEPGFREF